MPATRCPCPYAGHLFYCNFKYLIIYVIQFLLNDTNIQTDLPAGSLLLDFARYHLHLSGTKIGCREGDCGACTMLAGEIIGDELVYRSVTSCLVPLGNARGKHIVTIEGLNTSDLNFIQQSFAEEGAAQCGFCTPGFIVSLAGYCLTETNTRNQSLLDAIDGNICRCTGYKSIERAVTKIAGKLDGNRGADPIDTAVKQIGLPGYFKTIKIRLRGCNNQTNGAGQPTPATTRFLGGGTDLYVQHPETMEDADINFLLGNAAIKGITQQGNRCALGAAVTVTDMLESPIFQSSFPSLNKYMKLIASTQIRNLSTVAGNMINASPIGDLTVFFLALDARVILSDGNNRRMVPLQKFYKGYKIIDKDPEEIIEQISFDLPGENTLFNFEKVSKRTNLDIASVNSAICLVMEGDIIRDAALSAGGVAPVPAFLEQASTFLRGKAVSPVLIAHLLDIVQGEISPISDTRGTVTYKRILLAQLIKAHFLAFFPEMKANELIHL